MDDTFNRDDTTSVTISINDVASDDTYDPVLGEVILIILTNDDNPPILTLI